jgi:hypothetical protein
LFDLLREPFYDISCFRWSSTLINLLALEVEWKMKISPLDKN